MAYTPQTWNNGSGGGTPLSASRMSYMETGIDGAHDIADAALPLAGGTMSGLLTLSGAPTSSLHAATKSYVDTNALLKTGGTMTGKITLDGNPTSSLHASTKQYVDSAVAGLSLPMVYLGRTSASGSSTSISASLSATYDHFLVVGKCAHTGTGVATGRVRLNNDSTNNYDYVRSNAQGDGSMTAFANDASDGLPFFIGGTNAGFRFHIIGRDLGHSVIIGSFRCKVGGTPSGNRLIHIECEYLGGPATSLRLVTEANNLTSNTFFDLYGLKTS